MGLGDVIDTLFSRKDNEKDGADVDQAIVPFSFFVNGGFDDYLLSNGIQNVELEFKGIASQVRLGMIIEDSLKANMEKYVSHYMLDDISDEQERQSIQNSLRMGSMETTNMILPTNRTNVQVGSVQTVRVGQTQLYDWTHESQTAPAFARFRKMNFRLQFSSSSDDSMIKQKTEEGATNSVSILNNQVVPDIVPTGTKNQECTIYETSLREEIGKFVPEHSHTIGTADWSFIQPETGKELFRVRMALSGSSFEVRVPQRIKVPIAEIYFDSNHCLKIKANPNIKEFKTKIDGVPIQEFHDSIKDIVSQRGKSICKANYSFYIQDKKFAKLTQNSHFASTQRDNLHLSILTCTEDEASIILASCFALLVHLENYHKNLPWLMEKKANAILKRKKQFPRPNHVGAPDDYYPDIDMAGISSQHLNFDFDQHSSFSSASSSMSPTRRNSDYGIDLFYDAVTAHRVNPDLKVEDDLERSGLIKKKPTIKALIDEAAAIDGEGSPKVKTKKTVKFLMPSASTKEAPSSKKSQTVDPRASDEIKSESSHNPIHSISTQIKRLTSRKGRDIPSTGSLAKISSRSPPQSPRSLSNDPLDGEKGRGTPGILK